MAARIEEKCFAAEVLHERGLRLSAIREELARPQSEMVTPNRPKERSRLAEFSRDLTQAAIDNSFDPLIGRVYELERTTIQIRSPRLAPSATRMPISRVRRATDHATTPYKPMAASRC